MVQAVREALQYLSWENSALSVKVLDAVFSVCKKADAQALYQLAPVRLSLPCRLSCHVIYRSMDRHARAAIELL